MATRASRTERHRIGRGIAIYRRPDSPVWQGDIHTLGRRLRRSLGTEDRDEARRLALEIAATRPRQRHAAAPYTVSDALTNWLNYAPRSERERSMARIFSKRYTNRPASEADEGNIVDALADLSAGYANRIMSIVRAALRLAARQKRIANAPTIVMRPTGEAPERYLSEAEWRRLRAALPDYLIGPVEFSLCTGLRKSNVLKLRWAQVDMRRRRAWVPAMRAKSRKAIPIPLPPAALAILRAQRGRHDEFVFTRPKNPRAIKNRDQQPLVPIGDPKNAWTTARKLAKVKDFRWHDQRHTWASWHAREGTPLLAIKDLGGWASADMVARYAHLAPSHLVRFAGIAAAAMGIGTPARKQKVAR